MEQLQILIVGGGPAGSSCAKRLLYHGLDVLVLDKQVFPRDKTCAGWVTPPVFDALGIEPANYPADNVLQPITGFRTGMLGGKEVRTQFDRIVSYGIRRCEFDDYLLQQSGAPTRLGQTLKSLERDGDGWIVNGSIRAELVVGAGGHFCPVARLLGNRKQPRASVVAAQEIEFEVSPEELDRGSVVGETPELFFCRDLQGYGWCFRKANFLNIGLGRVDRDGLSEHVAEFCRFLQESGKVVCKIPEKLHGHAYQLYERITPNVCDDGVLLVGDAAGLSYPQSGEGIRPAVESALMAADVIATANGNYRKDRLAEYATRIVQRFGKPRSTAITDHLPHGMLRFLAARLMASRWFARRVILDKWFLHTADPPLAAAPG